MSTKIVSLLIIIIISWNLFSMDNTNDIAGSTDTTMDNILPANDDKIINKFIINGYYKNVELNSFFKFEENKVYFSKFKNDNPSHYSYDLSGDVLKIRNTPSGELVLKIEDGKTLYLSNILYSGYYSLLNKYDQVILESDLTGDINSKLSLLSNIIDNKVNDSNAGTARVYNARGELYYGQKEYDGAIDDFTKAIKDDPTASSYYRNRGYAYIYKSDNNNAFGDLDSAIETNPDNADEFLYFSRGGLNYINGKNNQAINDFDKSIEKSPKFTEAYNFRGNAYSNIGDYENAIKDFTKVIELDPDSKSAYIDRGKAYSKIKNYINAFTDFDKGGYIPEESYDFVAKYYFDNIDFTGAKKFYDLAIGVKPSNPELYYYRGFIYFATGDLQKSLNDFNKAVELKKDYSQAYNFRGIVQFMQNKYAQALNDFSKAIEINNTYADPYLLRLICASYAGKNELRKYSEISTNAINFIEDRRQKSLLEYFTDNIDTTTLLYVTMSDKTNINERISETYFYIAIKNQLKGLNSNAKTSYQISIDAASKLNFTYYLSIALIKKIK